MTAQFCGFVAFAHVMEPEYPGVLGHYINLGMFYDRKRLRPLAEKQIELKEKYQASYKRAYQCLRAAHEVRSNGEQVFLTPMMVEKVTKRADGILSREIKRKKGKRGKEVKRFLGGITCQGLLCFYKTLESQCKRIYELQENCGVAHLLLQRLKESALDAGYDVMSFPSPEDPARLEHMMIPELSLAFITTMPNRALEKRPYRRIRMESMIDKEIFRVNRAKLRFAHRVANELMEDGMEALRQAKSFHDEMEAIYHPYVNFAGVNRVTKALIEEIEQLT